MSMNNDGQGQATAGSTQPGESPQDAVNGAQTGAVQSPPANQNTPGAGQALRIPVNPGETVTLPPPFDADHNLAAKEGNGYLAIKVGNVTVILEGYVEASRDPTHPV